MRVPTWGVVMMLVASVLGSWLLAVELWSRVGP